jgi:hypothetical protein
LCLPGIDLLVQMKCRMACLHRLLQSAHAGRDLRLIIALCPNSPSPVESRLHAPVSQAH